MNPYHDEVLRCELEIRRSTVMLIDGLRDLDVRLARLSSGALALSEQPHGSDELFETLTSMRRDVSDAMRTSRDLHDTLAGDSSSDAGPALTSEAAY